MVELGVNFIDTADSYGPEVSERLIGESLSPYAKGVVIATKAGLTRQGPNQWLPVGRPEYLNQQVEMSLRRLKVERIDLWQLHRIDPKVPVEESLGVIKKLQEQGKIRHVGLSEVKPHEIDQARKVIDIVSRAESVQPRRPAARRRSRLLHEAQPRVHSMVPSGIGQAREIGRQAGRSGQGTQRYRLPTLVGVAAAPFSGDSADCRNDVGGASRRKRCSIRCEVVSCRVESDRRLSEVNLFSMSEGGRDTVALFGFNRGYSSFASANKSGFR